LVGQQLISDVRPCRAPLPAIASRGRLSGMKPDGTGLPRERRKVGSCCRCVGQFQT
jgi:hypothetical protein